MIVRIRGLCILLTAALACGSMAVAAQSHATPQHAAKAVSARALKRKASYSLGVLMGTQLRQLGLTSRSLDVEQFARGIDAVVRGQVKATAADRKNVRTLIEKMRAAMASKNAAIASKNREVARKFLAANAKRKGVVTTPSGLQYKILRPGHGASPRPTDDVTVNYRGTLLNGTVFDSSARHGGPATFPVDHVIKGWQEALVKMKPGAKWELYIPPQLAYGNDSPAATIPPGSLLKFEVDLISVKPAAKAPAARAH